jgi:isopentenyl phosphate kinase
MDIVAVKIGGSLITKKDKPFTIDLDAIERFAVEIDTFLSMKDRKEQLILVHGGGSFSHTVASSYISKINSLPELDYGFILISAAARDLNTKIIKALLDYGIRAFPLESSAIIIKQSNSLSLSQTALITKVLEMGWVPVFYGDVIVDSINGECKILSGEEILRLLAFNIPLKKIVVLTDTNGVLRDTNDPNSTIDHIDQQTLKKYIDSIGPSNNKDVTGGMIHKVQILLDIANQKGVKSFIVNGKNQGSLLRAINGDHIAGTYIGD